MSSNSPTLGEIVLFMKKYYWINKENRKQLLYQAYEQFLKIFFILCEVKNVNNFTIMCIFLSSIISDRKFACIFKSRMVFGS